MSTGPQRRADRVIVRLSALTPHLWATAIVLFGGVDLVSTGIGFASPGVVEAGVSTPIIARFGLPSLVVLKLLCFLVAGLLWRFVPRPHRLGVPLALASLGVVVSVWNLAVIFAATT